ncbi:MAG: NAD(P)-dependent oxidoreductase [Rhodospirillales bacterium]|nr:NAD(P)-dependent oxidoreductase [Rhodospirillales bacterium]
MAVLITGASGYIGHHLTKRLVEENKTVTAILRPSSQPDRLRALGGGVRLYVDDGTPDGLASAFDGGPVETVFHLAAHRPGGGEEDRDATLEANVDFSTRLWHAARQNNCKAFINTGSYWQFDAAGKPAPNSFYAETKQTFQDFLYTRPEDGGLAAVTLVLFDVYGPGDWRGGLTAAFGRAAQGEPVDMSGGEQVLDMIHVSDVVDGFLNAATLLKRGDIGPRHRAYFLGSEHPATLKNIAAVFEAACGRPLALNWGALDYHPNQIFQPCPADPMLPEWKPSHSLGAGFAELAGELNLSNTV